MAEPPDEAPLINREVAERLRQAADLLRQQGANPFRVGAYRRAADAVARHRGDLRDVLAQQGIEGLEALPHVGRGIARAIVEMLRTGHWSRLDRLRGTLDPVRLFQSVPGLGRALARRIHDALDIDTLEALELAAHDGRLLAVPGLGARRVAAVRAALATMLGPARGWLRDGAEGPPVAVLLDVDHEYREKAEAGLLRTIAPRRFHPSRAAWLPVLHTRRGSWHFSVLYSNTARAHELGRTRDWVVVYFYDNHHQEGQQTVVTEPRGSLAGKRVVRGREAETLEHYGRAASAAAPAPPRTARSTR